MNTSRYYWSRLRTGPKAGTYRVFDRVLEIHIAECSFKENAELIVGALNSASSSAIASISLKQDINQNDNQPNTTPSPCPNTTDHTFGARCPVCRTTFG